MVELKVRCIKCGTLRIVKVHTKHPASVELLKRRFVCDDCQIKIMRQADALPSALTKTGQADEAGEEG